jgi:hypothetical protein
MTKSILVNYVTTHNVRPEHPDHVVRTVGTFVVIDELGSDHVVTGIPRLDSGEARQLAALLIEAADAVSPYRSRRVGVGQYEITASEDA